MKEITITPRCDNASLHGEQRPVATMECDVSLDGGKTVIRIDACDTCKALIADLEAMLSNGMKVEKEKPADEAQTCPVCKGTLKNRATLAAHVRNQHDTTLRKLGL